MTMNKQPKKIMFGVTVEQIKSHDPSLFISYLRELEGNGEKELRGCIQLFGNNVYNTDEKLLKSGDFHIWASYLCLDYNKFAFFLNSQSIFLIMMADLMGSGLYHISKEKQIEFLDTVLPDCINLGIKMGYTNKEMVDYYNQNILKQINKSKMPPSELGRKSRPSDEDNAKELAKLNRPESLGSKATEDFLNLTKK